MSALSAARRHLTLQLVIASTALAAACSQSSAPRASRTTPPPPSQVSTTAKDPESFRLTVPSAGKESAWTYPAPSLATLSNGLKIYVVERPIGPVALSLVVRHGGSDVVAAKSGLASLTAQMMVEATKTKNHYVLSETAESLGSTLAGDANRDSLRLTLDTLAEDVDRGIALLAEALMAPAFDSNDFDRLQKQHLDDLSAERQNPSRMASMIGMRAVLGPRHGVPVGGRVPTVRKLTVADVRDWHRRYALPTDTALFVVGPVDATKVLASAERILGTFNRKAAAPAAPETVPEANQGGIYVVDRPGSVQTAVFAVQPYPKRLEPGHAARQVLDNVIGGQFTSRINQNLRERNAYTYGARSAAIGTRYFGLFTLSTSVETDVTAMALKEIVKELRELKGANAQRPIAMDELARAKTGIVQSLGAHLEDGHRLLVDQELLFVYGLAPDYFVDYLTEVRGLDLATVSRETERLTPDRLVFVLVGDGVRIRAQLDAAQLTHTTPPPDWLE